MQVSWVLLVVGLSMLSASTLAKLLSFGDEDELLPAARNPSLTSQEQEDLDSRMKVADFVRDVKRVLSGIRRRTSQSLQLEKRFRQAGRVNKRHCWDVADVCCMWNIC